VINLYYKDYERVKELILFWREEGLW